MPARVLAVLACLGASASAAWAQSDRLRPPTPDDLQGTPTILTLLATVLIVALVIFAAAFPSKRGHQD